MRQHLIDIVLVSAIALSMYLAITWLQSRQEALVVEETHNIAQRGTPIIQEADGLLFDKPQSHTPLDNWTRGAACWQTPGGRVPLHGPHVSSRDHLHAHAGR